MTRILKGVEGVKDVQVDFKAKKAKVQGEKLSGEVLVKALKEKSKGQYKASVVQ